MIESKSIERQQERQRLRATANHVILHLHPAKVPARALRLSYTWGLGGISALLLLLLVGTGLLLMFRYDASVEGAYASIQALETVVPFGSLVRAIHHWSANLLIVTVFLHLLRVFLTGSYKEGRGLNWTVGIGLLLLVIAFNFTGYLLPWDQLSYWAITVGTSLIAYLPLVGEALSRLVLAGPEIGPGTLRNFYAFHVALLPALLIALALYHFWRIRKDGGISQPPWQPGAAQGERPERLTTIPHLVQRELAAVVVVLVLVVVWAMLRPAPLVEIADPVHSPNPAKAAWYFLGFQELLLHMDVLAALGLITLVLLGLLLLPRLDPDAGSIGVYFRSARGRWAALSGVLLGLLLVPVLVLADEYWINLPALLPAWPLLLSNGLLPLLASVAGLLVVYGALRLALRANHGEGLLGLFSFIFAGLIVMTLIGIYLRGENMALVLPF